MAPEFVVSDDHQGLRRSLMEMLPEAAWQRCYVHFLRNALDHLPRKASDDCLQELRWLYDRRDVSEAQEGTSPPGFPVGRQPIPSSATPVEENIYETLTFYRLPRGHHKHLKSTNMLKETKRGDQTPDPGGQDLPQPRQLPQAHPGTGREDPRELARGTPLSEHGSSCRAQTGTTTATKGGSLRRPRH